MLLSSAMAATNAVRSAAAAADPPPPPPTHTHTPAPTTHPTPPHPPTHSPGLMSRCRMPWEWHCASVRSTARMYEATVRSATQGGGGGVDELACRAGVVMQATPGGACRQPCGGSTTRMPRASRTLLPQPAAGHRTHHPPTHPPTPVVRLPDVLVHPSPPHPAQPTTHALLNPSR